MDTDQFGGAFWITITGIILGFLGTMTAFCLKFKCKECNVHLIFWEIMRM